MSTLGIDFGTSFSSVSWINPVSNKPEIVTFLENGLTKLPSIIFIPEKGEPRVGSAPYEQLRHINEHIESEQEYILAHTVKSVKRKLSPHNIGFRTEKKSYTYVELVALILSKLRSEAIRSCVALATDPPTDVVLTHPALMGETQKSILAEAATKAGFKTVTFLEEPVAAAVGFVRANNLQNAKGVIVYDFGGGTFDVAYVVRGDDGEFHIPFSPLGDLHCGGDDIDNVLYDNADRTAKQTLKHSISRNKDERDLGAVIFCREQKELLSIEDHINKLLPIVSLDGESTERIPFYYTRESFNGVIAPIINRTIDKTKELYKQVKNNHLPVDFIVLIGGSSRIPVISEKLKKEMPDIEICTTGATDIAVALGASYYKLAPIPRPVDEWCDCSQCKKRILKSYKFCIYCGTKNHMYGKQ